jgi:hypothetical protein
MFCYQRYRAIGVKCAEPSKERFQVHEMFTNFCCSHTHADVSPSPPFALIASVVFTDKKTDVGLEAED